MNLRSTAMRERGCRHPRRHGGRTGVVGRASAALHRRNIGRGRGFAGADRFPTYEAGRGGQWTYHGPGQRVAYLMLDLQKTHGLIPPRDIRSYVTGLERWVIATLKGFGIKGETREGQVASGS